MFLYKYKNYKLDNSLDFYFSERLSCIFIKGQNGLIKVLLPSFYFFKKNNNNFSLLFDNNFFFSSVLSHINTYSKTLCFCYFLKLRLRGLGFRIRSITKSLCFFFFNYTNNFYFHVPKDILVKVYKKRIFLFSYNWSKLRSVFTHILFLKKLGPYRMLGVRYKRQVIHLKKLEKKF